MENIRDIVRENLVKLRKEHKWTQMELAERIGYSDKAISRWETGEVTPDIETLNVLSELYDIPMQVFFEPYEPAAYKSQRFHELHMGKKLAIALLVITWLWFVGTVAYIYLEARGDMRPWMAFIWPLPLTFLLAIGFNRLWGNRILGVIFNSGFCWTTITAIYLQLVDYNLFMLFVSGVPIQLALILWAYIRPRKERGARLE